MTTLQSNAGNDAKEKKDDIAAGAHKLVDNVEEKAEAAGEKLQEYKETAKEALHKVNNTSLADMEKQVSACIRDNPTRSLLGAAAVGIVIGILLWRR